MSWLIDSSPLLIILFMGRHFQGIFTIEHTRFTRQFVNFRQDGADVVLATFVVRSVAQCASNCRVNDRCRAFNIGRRHVSVASRTGELSCELLDTALLAGVVSAPGWSHYTGREMVWEYNGCCIYKMCIYTSIVTCAWMKLFYAIVVPSIPTLLCIYKRSWHHVWRRHYRWRYDGGWRHNSCCRARLRTWNTFH